MDWCALENRGGGLTSCFNLVKDHLFPICERTKHLFQSCEIQSIEQCNRIDLLYPARHEHHGQSGAFSTTAPVPARAGAASRPTASGTACSTASAPSRRCSASRCSSWSATRWCTAPAPAISRFGLGFVFHTTWAAELRSIRRRLLSLRHRRQLRDGNAAGGPDRDRDRALPESAGASGGARDHLAAGRDAGGDPQRHPRLLGRPDPGALRARTPRALPSQHAWASSRSSAPPRRPALSLFTAGLILTIMVIPIIASISRDLFRTVPLEIQDGASALGATRWEVVRGVVLPSTASGVVAAVAAGPRASPGRGDRGDPGGSAAGPKSTHRCSKPATRWQRESQSQFLGASPGIYQSSLFYLGLILLVIGLLSNLCARLIGRRFDYQRKAALMSGGGVPDPTAPLTPSGNLRRRQLVSRLAMSGATLAALAAVAVLVIVVYSVLGARGQRAQLRIPGQGRAHRDRAGNRRHRPDRRARDRDRDAAGDPRGALPDRVRRRVARLARSGSPWT